MMHQSVTSIGYRRGRESQMADQNATDTEYRSSNSPFSAPPSQTISLHGLLRAFLSHKGKIVAALLSGLALAISYIALVTPSYTATASIFVDPRTRKVVTDEILQGGFGSDLSLVESQVSILTSDAVLRRVVEKLNLTADPDFVPVSSDGLVARLKKRFLPKKEEADPTAVALQTLAQLVKAQRAQKTYVIDVEVTHKSPSKAAKIADAMVDAYIADQTAAKSNEAKRVNSLIDSRLDELRNQVRIADTRVDDFKKTNKILTSEGAVVTEQELNKMSAELITARAVAAENKARSEQIQSAITAGTSPETLSDGLRAYGLQRLRDQLTQVARREAALSSQLQPRHPLLVEVRSQLAEVKTQITTELQRVASAAQNDYQVAANREKDLAAQIERTKDDVGRTNTAQIKLRELEQEAQASRELLKVFLTRAKETREQENISTPDARIITPATIPTKSSKLSAVLVLSLGLLGGLGLGLISALAFDHFDPAVHSAADLEVHSGLPTVGELPLAISSSGFMSRFRSHNTDVPDAGAYKRLLAAVSPGQPGSDPSYRRAVVRLLGKIYAVQKPGRPHTVMVVAPHTEAGSSGTAIALAYTAAVRGDRVLLVDTTSVDTGVSTAFADDLVANDVVVLDNKHHLAKITVREPKSGLKVLPIAFADLRLLKMQQRRRLAAGLNALAQDFDLVFIDAGSALDDEAATCLLPVADQVLVVARARMTKRSDLDQVYELIDNGGPRLAGNVLNYAG